MSGLGSARPVLEGTDVIGEMLSDVYRIVCTEVCNIRSSLGGGN